MQPHHYERQDRMTFRALPWLAIAFSSIACATSFTPRTNTRADLEAYVRRAADVVRERGGAGACEALAQPAWMSGDYYIFVNELDTNVAVCHPLRPDFVGQNQDNLRDANGRDVTREMRTAVTSAGSGWVDYVWPRPGQTNPIPKSAFVVRATGPDGKSYVVGSGGYGLAP